MIAVEIRNLELVRKNLERYTRTLPQSTDRGLWLSSLRLAKRLREDAPKASGYMKSRKGTKATKLRKGEYGIKMPYYTDYVERDITRSKGIPPVGKVLRWETKKGHKLAGLRKTTGHPFTNRTIMRTMPEIIKIMKKHTKYKGGKR